MDTNTSQSGSPRRRCFTPLPSQPAGQLCVSDAPYENQGSNSRDNHNRFMQSPENTKLSFFGFFYKKYPTCNDWTRGRILELGRDEIMVTSTGFNGGKVSLSVKVKEEERR